MNDGKSCLHVSVDGTDVLICEQTPFDPKWWSHKHKHAALRYEVGISTHSGEIVSVYGPFPAGQCNDQAIFNLKMGRCLQPFEKVLGDQGYGGVRVVHGGILGDADEVIARRIRAYHETVNGRLKTFCSLQYRWRHDVRKHHLCFFAVANLVQLMIKNKIV